MPWQVFELDRGRPKFVGEIDEPADCFGDDLYIVMKENEWIYRLEDYDFDGDNEHIAVMPKKFGGIEYSLHFFEWEQFTRRTNEPKLKWLEYQLDQAGIFHRRNGESFHAPIMEVAKHQIDGAWKILDPVDDIPDDDDMFGDFRTDEFWGENIE